MKLTLMWINRIDQNEQEQQTKGNGTQAIFRRDSISRQYRVDANSVFLHSHLEMRKLKNSPLATVSENKRTETRRMR